MTDANGVDQARWQKGVEVIKTLYGPEFAELMDKSEPTPTRVEVVEHLFGEVLSRPGLSVREKRIMLLSAVAMLGRADLLEVQMRGALLSGDLDDDDFEEMAMVLMFYAGMPNVTAFKQAAASAKKKQVGVGASFVGSPR